MANTAILSVISEDQLVPSPNHFNQGNKDNKFQEMLEASNKKEAKPKPRGDAKREEAQDEELVVVVSEESEKLNDNTKLIPQEIAVEVILPNINLEQPIIAVEPPVVALEQSSAKSDLPNLVKVDEFEENKDILKDILAEKEIVLKESSISAEREIVLKELPQEIEKIEENIDTNSVVPVVEVYKSVEFIQVKEQAKEIDISQLEKSNPIQEKQVTLALEQKLNQQEVALKAQVTNAEQAPLHNNELVANPLSSNVIQLPNNNNRAENKQFLDVDANKKSLESITTIENHIKDGDNHIINRLQDIKQNPLSSKEVFAPLEQVIVDDVNNDQLFSTREKIDNIGNFVLQYDAKKPIISFKEISSQQSENIPHRNDQISMAVKAAVNGGYSEITLKMYPESLGVVDVIIEFSGRGIVSAIRISAEKPETLELLAKDYAILEQALNKVVKADNASLSFDLKGDNGNNSNYNTPEQNQENMPTHLILQQIADEDNVRVISNKEYQSGIGGQDHVDIKV